MPLQKPEIVAQVKLMVGKTVNLKALVFVNLFAE